MKLKDAIRILALERDDWETSHCTPAYRREAFDTAIKALEAQDVPDINDGNMIYRQVAIDALERIFDRCEEIESHLPEGDPDRTGYKMYPDYMTVWKYLHQVPSAQPEPCDDPRADVYYLAEKIGIHQLYALVLALRGEPEPCEDAVSRRRLLNDLKELIAAWKKYPVMTEQIKGVETAIGYVEKIPSVTPKRKTGRWVFHRPPDDWVLSLFTCDQCGYMNEGEPRYCPGCGAKMDRSE